jgi:hypothetical protein
MRRGRCASAAQGPCRHGSGFYIALASRMGRELAAPTRPQPLLVLGQSGMLRKVVSCGARARRMCHASAAPRLNRAPGEQARDDAGS